jgi:uracil-DNA glycosylase
VAQAAARGPIGAIGEVMQSQAYLDALGIDLWLPRRRLPGERAAAGLAMAVAPATAAPAWDELAATVRACTLCGLHKTRTQTVFGVGNRQADLLVVGEAPGADEDAQGEPFVGRAGQLLNAILRGLHWQRSDVYIANVLKCRPPNNRDPSPEESARCMPYLHRQIELIAPRMMLAVGRIAAQNLLATDTPIGKLRGVVHRFGPRATPLIVTYHPAYLLRSPGEKRKVWGDMKFLRQELKRGHR